MDEAGQFNFAKALNVAKQVFNSLTEYIQVKTDFFIPAQDGHNFLHLILITYNKYNNKQIKRKHQQTGA